VYTEHSLVKWSIPFHKEDSSDDQAAPLWFAEIAPGEDGAVSVKATADSLTGVTTTEAVMAAP
jgi:hypothetical protein